MEIFRNARAALSYVAVGSVVLMLPALAQAYEYKAERGLSPAPLFSKSGMVSSSHPLASQVGVNILQKGGNAFDAAVATALTLNAVDMSMCGPGGRELLAALGCQGRQAPHSLDADTQAPAAATPDKFKDRSELLSGVKAMGIPGNMKAYTEVLSKFGTMKFAEVVQPGAVLSPRTATCSASAKALPIRKMLPRHR